MMYLKWMSKYSREFCHYVCTIDHFLGTTAPLNSSQKFLKNSLSFPLSWYNLTTKADNKVRYPQATHPIPIINKSNVIVFAFHFKKTLPEC